MTKEELIQFLKDNLVIRIDEEYDFSYSERQRKRIVVELRLQENEYHSEVISSDSVTIDLD